MDPNLLGLVALVLFAIQVGILVWFITTLNAIKTNTEQMAKHLEQLATKNHDEIVYTVRKVIVDLRHGGQ